MTNQIDHEGNEVYEQLRQMMTAVGDTCFSAAITAYENARIDGLCHDGAWECALDAMRAIKFESVPNRNIIEKNTQDKSCT